MIGYFPPSHAGLGWGWEVCVCVWGGRSHGPLLRLWVLPHEGLATDVRGGIVQEML